MIPSKAIKKFTKDSHREIVLRTLLSYGLFPGTSEGIDQAKKFVSGLTEWIAPSELPNYYDGIDSDLQTGRETAGIINIRNLLNDFYFNNDSTEENSEVNQEEAPENKEVTLIINEVKEENNQQPIEVEVNVPSVEASSTQPAKRKIIRAKGIKNTIKKTNKTRELVGRMARSFDKRLENLVDAVQNPPPTPPIKLKKPKKIKQVSVKRYNFNPKTSNKSASNFNEFVFNKLGSAFSLAAQARKYNKESGGPEQEKGFFIKKALRHEFGGDLINRMAGTFSSNPEKNQDPALSKGKRFAASLSPFLNPPTTLAAAAPQPQYVQPSLFETENTETVKVNDTSLKEVLKNRLTKLQLSYDNLNKSVSSISTSGGKKEDQSVQNNDSILGALQKSFDSINKSLKKSNQLNKEENKSKQLSLDLYKDSVDRQEMDAEAASIASTRDSSGTVGYKKADYTSEGILGSVKRFLSGDDEQECDCEDDDDDIDLDRRRKRRRSRRKSKSKPKSRFRIRARMRLARRWASRQLAKIKKIKMPKMPKFKMPNIKMPNIRMPGIGGGGGMGGGLFKGAGGLLRGAGGLAGRLLRIPLVADMLFPEGTSSYDQISGPNAYYNAPGYSGPRPPEAPPEPPKPQAEGSYVNITKTETKPKKMAEGGTNVISGEAGPEMWLPQRKALEPSTPAPQSNLFSSAGLILGTTSKILRSAGPVAGGTRSYIEQQIGPLSKMFGRPQYNLTTKIGKNISAVKEPKVDGEEGLLGLLKKLINFVTGNGEEDQDKTQPTTPSPSGSDAGQYKELLDMIAGVESTSSGGYDAFNRGGSAGGTVAHGSGNSNQDAIGGVVKPLSQRTVAEVMRLQAAGELHATGRYQIIASTLKGLINGNYGDTGVKPTDLYDAVTQDKLGISLIKYRLKTGATPSNFRSEWVGLQKVPDDKLSAAINNANAAYQANPNATATAAPSAAPSGSPASTAPPGNAPTVRAVGDSLAEGASKATKGAIKDNATSGLNPTKVNQSLRSAGINKGNTGQVLLSTGLANDPTQRDQALQQMQYLKTQGIPFTVMPLPTQLNEKYRKEKGLDTNAWLSSAVPQQGGMMAPSISAGSDGVHATSQEYLRMLNLARLAQ